MTVEKDSQHALQESFDNELQVAIQSLSENFKKEMAGSIFGNDQPPLEEMVKAQLNKIRVNATDSISLQAAIELCDLFVDNKVFTELYRSGKKAFAAGLRENYQIEDSVLIPMPDGGIVSATIVKSKKLTGPQPVILNYNIYPGGDTKMAMDAVDKGYIGMVANTRGKRLSADSIFPFERDAEDAWYIIDWVTHDNMIKDMEAVRMRMGILPGGQW